jgi:hypothetical protein
VQLRGATDIGVVEESTFRKATADRDAFQRYVCHTWTRMSCQTPVIRRGSEAQRGARGTPSRRQVTYKQQSTSS